MRRIFLSGPVTGKKPEEAATAFRKAEMWVLNNALRKDEIALVVNPLTIGATCDREAMKALMPLLCECDTIVLLPGHEFSEGSKIEAALARYLKLSVIIIDEL